ncbi:hypothetical protein [Streptomyces sp. NBC_00827]|uniref:hypothetical protein n=1 Tax=Streptomyces sp. NBC_00827 TaxID=2903677 RepID=UPI00386AEB70|nr:hypothetical protein OG569_27870 [Streptomyces sp. NBC_00827]
MNPRFLIPSGQDTLQGIFTVPRSRKPASRRNAFFLFTKRTAVAARPATSTNRTMTKKSETVKPALQAEKENGRRT